MAISSLKIGALLILFSCLGCKQYVTKHTDIFPPDQQLSAIVPFMLPQSKITCSTGMLKSWVVDPNARLVSKSCISYPFKQEELTQKRACYYRIIKVNRKITCPDGYLKEWDSTNRNPEFNDVCVQISKLDIANDCNAIYGSFFSD